MSADECLSQEQLAHEAGLTTSGNARVESAKVAGAWSNVHRIAEALEVSLAELGRRVEAER